MQLGEVNMDFAYADYFGLTPSTGYERLLPRLHDRRCHSLPARRPWSKAGWSIVNSRASTCGRRLPPRNFPNYRRLETWGPRESDELMERDGRRWRKCRKMRRNL